MGDFELRYDQMVENALRGVVREALTQVAEEGLPGDHHFYITFRTDAPGVEIPDTLRENYPSEMTIVLQHQFWELIIEPEIFHVTLSFSNQPHRLSVPFDTIVAFADPSVRFGLQFDLEEGAEEGLEQPGNEPGEAEEGQAQESDNEDSGTEGTGKVITLDSFRKK